MKISCQSILPSAIRWKCNCREQSSGEEVEPTPRKVVRYVFFLITIPWDWSKRIQVLQESQSTWIVLQQIGRSKEESMKKDQTQYTINLMTTMGNPQLSAINDILGDHWGVILTAFGYCS